MFSFVFRANMLVFLKYYCTFVTLSSNNGALAHLARAFDWQSKGGRFESCMLHFPFPTPWELSPDNL
ncbi:unknown [Bacteroides sp. CAG:875]|nr:unknown [Bacteroides sp. CAG:875]